MDDRKPRFWFLYPLAWFAAFGVLLGCNLPADPAAKPTPKGDAPAAKPTKKADAAKVEVRKLDKKAVAELTQAFQDNPLAARKKYENTRWAFTATVRSFDTTLTATVIVSEVGQAAMSFRSDGEIGKPRLSKSFTGEAVVAYFAPHVYNGTVFEDATVTGP